MLSSLHVLLTYTCLYECDHCFLYCSPRSEGTFSRATLEYALDQGVEAGIGSVWFEGGEPFLFHPLLVEGVRLAHARGLKTGVVTNAYWATTDEDAHLWLAPLLAAGLDELSVSDDAFHASDPELSPAKNALRAAVAAGMPVGAICIQGPTVSPVPDQDDQGAVVGGDVLLRGRAVATLSADLPRLPYTRFDNCPHEDLEAPGRVHLDPLGNVFLCQGLILGNVGRARLADLLRRFDPSVHPIVGPLLRGGPAELARVHGLPDGEEYVDHCHLCWLVRRELVSRLPEAVGPHQVYGLDPTAD